MLDVVVIGGGMSGCIAALEAKKLGARVALARRSWGATALSTGALDIAYTPALSQASQMPRTLAEHVMDIVAHRRRHPYAVLGVERTIMGIRRGFDVLLSALEPAGLAPQSIDLEAENAMLPSSLGALMPAGSALAPHWGLDLTNIGKRRIGVLQLGGQAYFDARRVAAGIQADARSLSGGALELGVLSLAFEARLSPFVLARELDNQVVADSLARGVGAGARGFDILIAPPVLGLERHAAVRRQLAEAAGAPVVEAVAHMPSVPGVRLQRALERAVAAAQIETIGEVKRAHTVSGRVRAVVTESPEEVEAGAFVLAAGRFVTGGIRWDDRCHEALFGLPVACEQGVLEEDGPDAVTRETPMESHPLMTAGVQVNAGLQPLREGRVAFENLFAAGMSIGGFASRYVLCADGVAMCTGSLAGEAAAHKAGVSL